MKDHIERRGYIQTTSPARIERKNGRRRKRRTRTASFALTKTASFALTKTIKQESLLGCKKKQLSEVERSNLFVYSCSSCDGHSVMATHWPFGRTVRAPVASTILGEHDREGRRCRVQIL